MRSARDRLKDVAKAIRRIEQEQAAVSRGVAPRVSRQAKALEIKRQLNLTFTFTGITELVVLSIQNPCVAGAAHLNLIGPSYVMAKENYAAFPAPNPPSGEGAGFYIMGLFVNVKIALPNKVHLMTLYVDSWYDQQFSLSNAKVGDDRIAQTFDVQNGPSTILFAFIPKHATRENFILMNSSPYTFSRVEIDVVK